MISIFFTDSKDCDIICSNKLTGILQKYANIAYPDTNCLKFTMKTDSDRLLLPQKKNMIKPITVYGNPVLRKECEYINNNYPNIREVIETMWQTLKHADGCGLAAPQINLPIKLFIVNSRDTYAYMSAKEREHLFSEEDCGIEETFINAEIIACSKEAWTTGEGCLSIPGLYEEVPRPWSVTIKYQDSEFKEQNRTYYGYTARIIQHEFEHTQGKLYIDRLSPLRKQLIKNKLKRIIKESRKR